MKKLKCNCGGTLIQLEGGRSMHGNALSYELFYRAKCEKCGQIYGVSHQYDHGTGSDIKYTPITEQGGEG